MMRRTTKCIDLVFSERAVLVRMRYKRVQCTVLNRECPFFKAFTTIGTHFPVNYVATCGHPSDEGTEDDDDRKDGNMFYLVREGAALSYKGMAWRITPL
jgi:hypothetical protein